MCETDFDYTYSHVATAPGGAHQCDSCARTVDAERWDCHYGPDNPEESCPCDEDECDGCNERFAHQCDGHEPHALTDTADAWKCYACKHPGETWACHRVEGCEACRAAFAAAQMVDVFHVCGRCSAAKDWLDVACAGAVGYPTFQDQFIEHWHEDDLLRSWLFARAVVAIGSSRWMSVVHVPDAKVIGWIKADTERIKTLLGAR